MCYYKSTFPTGETLMTRPQNGLQRRKYNIILFYCGRMWVLAKRTEKINKGFINIKSVVAL